MQPLHDTTYVVTTWDGHRFETESVDDTRQALRDGGTVVTTTRTLYQSGDSVVRLYVSTEITDAAKL